MNDPSEDARKLHGSFMYFLCDEYKIRDQQGKPDEFIIREFHEKHYHGSIPLDHFKEIVKEMAVIYDEIQTKDESMWLRPDKVNDCSNYHRFWNS